MKYHDVHTIVSGVPYIGEIQSRFLYDFIIRNSCRSVLELGFAHGTASCYIAAALDEMGGGELVSVDLMETKDHFQPTIEKQLEKTGLARYVGIRRMETGYTWFLHDEILRNTIHDNCRQVYDLCIIDGPKNWTIDGCAFFLVDKLLNDGGWIIFDDYYWTY